MGLCTSETDIKMEGTGDFELSRWCVFSPATCHQISGIAGFTFIQPYPSQHLAPPEKEIGLLGKSSHSRWPNLAEFLIWTMGGEGRHPPPPALPLPPGQFPSWHKICGFLFSPPPSKGTFDSKQKKKKMTKSLINPAVFHTLQSLTGC